MSKKFFKVKNGLHVKPSDPSTITDPEVGDIIVDSQDDNKVKVYQDGEFSTISGSGGTVANFFADFDKLTPTVSNASVADDAVTFLPIDDNKKSKKATFSAAGSVLYEVASEADLEGNQGLMTVWIKTSLDSVTVSTTTDGVVQSTLSVLGTNKWKQYEIPFVVGGTDQGLIVEAGDAGDVFIDEPFVGLAPAGYIQQVGQAQFVGDINFNSTGCVWTVNTGTGFQSFPVNASCSYQTRGNILEPDTNIPAIKIPNARTDGYYKILINGIFGITNSSAADECVFNLSDSNSFNPNGGIAYTRDFGTSVGNGDRFANEITGQFKFTTSGDKTIQILAKPNASGDSCSVFASLPEYGGTISVHFFPDASATVVSQDTELTAKTANELSARIVSNGVVQRQNYDWINGDCVVTDTSLYTCNLNNINTELLNCVVTSEQINRTINLTNTTNQIIIRSQTANTGTNASANFHLQCSKSGADVNKSQTIVGKFEQVEEVNKELTASDVNELSVFVNSAGNIISSNYDWITCTPSTSPYTCTFNAGIFTQTPSCVATVNEVSGTKVATLTVLNNNSVTIKTYTASTGSGSSAPFNLKCAKQGADVNKNLAGVIINASQSAQEIADIVRTDIVSSDLVKIEAVGNSGSTYTGGQALDFIENSDNKGWFSGNKTITPTYDTQLLFVGTVALNAIDNRAIYVRKDGSENVQMCTYEPNTTTFLSFKCLVNVVAGSTYTIVSNSTITLANSPSHTLSITELPDTESIVKNLLAESSQTKCQTKYLSANVTSNGSDITDLKFNNLNIGKKYRVYYHASLSANSDPVITTSAVHDGTKYARTFCGNSVGLSQCLSTSVGLFTASASTLTFETTSFGGTSPTLFGSGDTVGTYVTLCQLPDTVVDTEEF